MKSTTIKVTKEMRDKLYALKIHPKDSYDDVIQRILKIIEGMVNSQPKFSLNHTSDL